jgi:hypothetical protein
MTTKHTELRQWPYRDGQLITTVHHIGDDGKETVEITGIHPVLRLQVEPDRGHEMDLPERCRRAAQ